MGRLANIVARRMIRAFVRLGWTVDRVSGSHHVLVKAGHRPITVPVHRGHALKEPVARAILKQAGVTEEEFFDAYVDPGSIPSNAGGFVASGRGLASLAKWKASPAWRAACTWSQTAGET